MHVSLASLAFPLWLRIDHYINLLFLGLLIRSGIQVLAAHPRLYWNDGCKPESAWLRFTRKPIPKDHLCTSMDEEVPVTPVLALPGRNNLGLGRAWHFFSFTFWFLNGVIYVILLFATGEWGRLIPTSWSIFPRAWENVVTYATLHIPPPSDFHPYAPLQQLIYAAVVFLLAPLMILTGAAMSPAIEARFPWYLRLFGGRQAARSLHFLVMVAFVLFTLVHTVLVLLAHFNDNLRHIVFGTGDSSVLLAIALAVMALLVVLAMYVWSSWFSLRHKRGMQHALGAVVDPGHDFVLQRLASKQHYPHSALSPYFWVNGRPPESAAFKQLVEHHFADWRLEIGGLVTNPLHLSLADLRQLPRQSQITLHNCVQGWTGIAEWTGGTND